MALKTIIHICFVYIAFHCISKTAEVVNGSGLKPFLSSSIFRGQTRRERKTYDGGVDEPEVSFDQFGGLPALENAVSAVALRSSAIVVIRTRNNCTVLAHQKRIDNSTSSSSSSLSSTSSSSSLYFPKPLYTSVFKPLIPINSHIMLATTGLAGDCRSLIKFTKEMVLNHSVAFDKAPSGRAVAKQIGRFLHKNTAGGGGQRPYACHAFLIDALEGSIFEIDTAGSSQEVIAGAAGVNMSEGRRLLSETLYRAAMDRHKAQRSLGEEGQRDGCDSGNTTGGSDAERHRIESVDVPRSLTPPYEEAIGEVVGVDLSAEINNSPGKFTGLNSSESKRPSKLGEVRECIVHAKNNSLGDNSVFEDIESEIEAILHEGIDLGTEEVKVLAVSTIESMTDVKADKVPVDFFVIRDLESRN